jgi:site-specific DNA-cytosine methylase
VTIAEQAEAMWPTPDAQVMNDGESPESFEARRLVNLAKHINGNGMGTPLAQFTQQWATATSHPRTHTPRDVDHGEQLANQVSVWATPQANADVGSRNCEGSAAHPGTSLADQVTTGSSRTGRKGNTRRLNPRFVAWLMGFPVDWTVEVSRTDQLRCLGNAVVPAQGAYATRAAQQMDDLLAPDDWVAW